MSALDFTSPLPFSSTSSKSAFKPIKFNLRQNSRQSLSSDCNSVAANGVLEKPPINASTNDAREANQVVESRSPPGDVEASDSTKPNGEKVAQEELEALHHTPSESAPDDEGSLRQCDLESRPPADGMSQLTVQCPPDPDIVPDPASTDVEDATKSLVRTDSNQSDENDEKTASYTLETMTLHEISSDSDSSDVERPYTDDDIDDSEAIDYSLDLREQNQGDAELSRDEQGVVNCSTSTSPDVPGSNSLDNVEGTIKPTSDDFVLPPPPPPPTSHEGTYTSHASFKVVSPSNKQSFPNPTWSANVDDLPPPPPPDDNFPLPPPPADLPASPPATSPTTPSFIQNEKPKGFRSVTRPTSKLGIIDNNKLAPSSSICKQPRMCTTGSCPVVQHGYACNVHPDRVPTPTLSPPNGYVTLLRDTRRILIKPVGSSNVREETLTNYSLHGKPFVSSHSADVKVTPETQLPKGAVYQTTTKEGGVIHTDTYFPAQDQGDPESVILERTKTTTLVQAPHHDGIGPVNETGVPCALRTTVDDSKHWYKNMFNQMHKVEPKEEITVSTPEVKSPYAEMVSSSTDDSHTRHSSVEIPKPKKVGRIFDYQPAQPYVVENKPVKLNLNHRPSYHHPSTNSIDKNKSTRRFSRSDSLEEFSRIKWNDYFEDVCSPSKPDAGNDEPKRNTSSAVAGSSKPQQPSSPNHYVPSYFTTSKNEAKDGTPEPKRTAAMPTNKQKAKQQPRKSSEPEVRTPARAKFDFIAQTAKEFAMKKGKTVIITRQVDSNWYMVQSVDGAKSGIVPVSYVEIISGTTPEKPLRNGHARAKFDFDGSSKKELSFKKGDEIILLKRVDDNWYKGKLSGVIGILPSVYVEVTLEPESPEKKKSQPPPQLIPAQSATSHSRQSSSVSQASGDEPDERERKQRAAFLANTVVKSSTPLHVRDNAKHREDVIDAVLREEVDVTSSTPTDHPSGLEGMDELDRVVESLSSPVKSPPSTPVSNQLAPPSSATLTPSIPSYPSSNVSTQPSSPQPASPPVVDYGQVIGTYVTLYAYEAGNDDELDLVPGDVVKVVETCDDGWYVGTCQRTGVFGTFPGNYVSLTSS